MQGSYLVKINWIKWQVGLWLWRLEYYDDDQTKPVHKESQIWQAAMYNETHAMFYEVE